MVKCLVNGMRDTATERSVHRYVRTCTRSTQFRSIGSRQCWSVSPWYSSSVYTALIYSNKNMSIVIETVSWPCSLAPVQPSTIHVGVAESAEEKKKIKMDREQIIRMLSNRGVGRCTCVLHAPHKVCELICMWDRHNVNISTLLHRQAGKKKHKLPVDECIESAMMQMTLPKNMLFTHHIIFDWVSTPVLTCSHSPSPSYITYTPSPSFCLSRSRFFLDCKFCYSAIVTWLELDKRWRANERSNKKAVFLNGILSHLCCEWNIPVQLWCSSWKLMQILIDVTIVVRMSRIRRPREVSSFPSSSVTWAKKF